MPNKVVTGEPSKTSVVGNHQTLLMTRPMVGGQPKTLGTMPNKVVTGEPSKTSVVGNHQTLLMARPMVGGQPKTLGTMPNKVVRGQPSKTLRFIVTAQGSISYPIAVKTCPRREADRCPKFRRSDDDSHDFKFANNSTMVACCQTWYHACLPGDAKESDPRSVTVESGYRESFSRDDLSQFLQITSL